MNDVQKFLFVVAEKYGSSFPEAYEEAFYILAEAVPVSLFAELTKQVGELDNGVS